MNNKRYKANNKQIKEMRRLSYQIVDRAAVLCPYIDREKLMDNLWFCMNSLVCCTTENWKHQLQRDDEAFRSLIADISKIDASDPLAILNIGSIFTLISVMGK